MSVWRLLWPHRAVWQLLWLQFYSQDPSNFLAVWLHLFLSLSPRFPVGMAAYVCHYPGKFRAAWLHFIVIIPAISDGPFVSGHEFRGPFVSIRDFCGPFVPDSKFCISFVPYRGFFYSIISMMSSGGLFQFRKDSDQYSIKSEDYPPARDLAPAISDDEDKSALVGLNIRIFTVMVKVPQQALPGNDERRNVSKHNPRLLEPDVRLQGGGGR